MDLERMRTTRRHLHRHPELSFKEVETTAYVEAELRSLGLTPRRLSETGVIADIEGETGGPRAMLRADIDALPITEETDFDFVSQRPGIMHACGHDGHTAILLEVARELVARQGSLPGSVRLVFQAAEELLPGGAKPLVEKGVLEGVDFALGLHLWSPLPIGQVAVSGGAIMANADTFHLHIRGKGGHAASPHQTIDSVLTAASFVQDLQSIVSRRVDPLHPAVLTVGTLHAGTADNVIPERAEISGTARSLDTATRQLLKKEVHRLAESLAHRFGATMEVVWQEGYPAVVNDPPLAAAVADSARVLLGDRAEVIAQIPSMGGEDFAYYSQKVPACFVWIGAGNPDLDADYPHHHPRFAIDEKALAIGADVLLGACLDRLGARQRSSGTYRA